MDRSTSTCKGSYGIDAPFLLPIPLLLIGLNVASAAASHSARPLIAAALITACMASGLYASRRGKFVVWTDLLERLQLRGDERVLDLGCGRGAVLNLAAKRLNRGQAIGVDLWRKSDQWGNGAIAAWHNAMTEGTADRVHLITANMAHLPLADGSIDLVVSNIALHNVKGPTRRRVLEEAVRVLRPGGRLLIADLMGTAGYEQDLKKLGLREVQRRSLGWRVWWSGPWLATQLVSGSKL